MSKLYNLYEEIDTRKKGIKDFAPDTLAIPEYITDNLKYPLFTWQKDAFENFLVFANPKTTLKTFPNLTRNPTHLMFNMATGAGKTLMMASLILYYYKQGYQHFLFFVNQNNIIDKTESNFIDSFHNKYLFTDKITIDGENIAIKKVETFSSRPKGIEIKFTSIHKLHNDIHQQRENRTTLSDLNKLDIVMLADEAHHLNSNTKASKGTANQQNELLEDDFDQIELKDTAKAIDVERIGWEHTVIELILNKSGKDTNNRNVLLEFTATLPDNESVAVKYSDKIISKFTLKEFLAQGYTKEINLISSTLGKEQRILYALLFAWYRHKIAIKYDIPNFKPVMLFRSKTIDESREDYDDFFRLVEKLEAKDLQFVENMFTRFAGKMQSLAGDDGKLVGSSYNSNDINQQAQSRTEQLLQFIRTNNISYGEIASWIKSNYQDRNIIITNSKTNTTKSEKTDAEVEVLLNSLENPNNHVRAIFTVDRLTEGWDVLNLFDIVRLYQGQNAGGSNKKTPEATTKEKQLIGRGVRYYPFNYGSEMPNKRKFDNEPNHELRILEELFYHTFDEESRYISHLKEELRKDGYIADNRTFHTFNLKESFKKSLAFNSIRLFKNEQLDNPNRQVRNIKDLLSDVIRIEYKVTSLNILEEEINLDDNEKDITRANIKNRNNVPLDRKIFDKDSNAYTIEKHIFDKALHIKGQKEGSFYRFKALQKTLGIESIDELQTQILAHTKIRFLVTESMTYEDILPSDKLNAILALLDAVQARVENTDSDKIGSEFTATSLKDYFEQPKTKVINLQNKDDNLASPDWYALDSFVGTSEEKALVQFIDSMMTHMKKDFTDIYLLRNEEVYKIYDFEQGRGFQPDFLMFFKTKKKVDVEYKLKTVSYQLFIEPKGNDYKGYDNTFLTGKEGWKESFLTQINEKYGNTETVLSFENQDYRLFGLPFFNESQETEKAVFEDSLIKAISSNTEN